VGEEQDLQKAHLELKELLDLILSFIQLQHHILEQTLFVAQVAAAVDQEELLLPSQVNLVDRVVVLQQILVLQLVEQETLQIQITQ